MAVRAHQLSVICPTLEERYSTLPPGPPQPGSGDYLFAILGSHKSKNPARSLAVCRQLLQLRRFGIRVNAPKHDQLDILRANLQIPEDIRVTVSITDEEKFALQSDAQLIAHLSLEEGFGIPLLEGLFLGRKIVALDTIINRELLGKASAGMDSAVFLLAPHAKEVNLDAFNRFLDAPAEPSFYQAIRDTYQAHWRASPAIMTAALDAAVAHYTAWGEKLQAKIFSSIPGTACGVADSTPSHIRAAPGQCDVFLF